LNGTIYKPSKTFKIDYCFIYAILYPNTNIFGDWNLDQIITNSFIYSIIYLFAHFNIFLHSFNNSFNYLLFQLSNHIMPQQYLYLFKVSRDISIEAIIFLCFFRRKTICGEKHRIAIIFNYFTIMCLNSIDHKYLCW